MHWKRFSFALVLWLLAPPLSAGAQGAAGADLASRAAARQLGQDGIEAFMAERYGEADEKLEQGYQLFATPTLGLWSARARMQLGRWLEAAERYRETLTLTDAVGNQEAQREALRDANTELQALLPRIPTLTVRLSGARPDEVKLSLDGLALRTAFIDVARPTNPGAHELVVQRGEERMVRQVRLAEGEHRQLPVEFQPPPTSAVNSAREAFTPPTAAPQAALEPEPASAPSPFVPLGIVALSLGGAGLAAAAVTYGLAQGECSDGRCRTKSSQSDYDTLQLVSTWSFWPGAVLIAGGLTSTLWGVWQRSDKEHVRLDVGPGGLSVRGTF